MKTIIYSLFFSLLAVALISSSGGRAAQGGQGNTGAPGDNNRVCANCHGTSIATSVSIDIKDAGGTTVTEYTPGEVYTVTFSIEENEARTLLYGFQMTSLIDATEEDVETWADPKSNTRIASAQGRQYAEHRAPSQDSVFSASWTAPMTDVGTITFYGAGISANGNGGTSGDGAGRTTYTLNPLASSNQELDLESLITRVNNEESRLSYSINTDTPVNIACYNMNGQKIEAQSDVRYSFKTDISLWPAGIYLVSFNTDGATFTDKVVKY